MRDPARIERILEKLKKIWEAEPDQRFGQLLINIGIVPYFPGNSNEVFYKDDDKTEKQLDVMIWNWKL